VKRASGPFLTPFVVEGPSPGQRVRIGDDNGVELGVQPLDPLEIGSGDRFGAHLPLLHQRLEVRDARLGDGRSVPCTGSGCRKGQQHDQNRTHDRPSFHMHDESPFTISGVDSTIDTPRRTRLGTRLHRVGTPSTAKGFGPAPASGPHGAAPECRARGPRRRDSGR